MKDQLLARMNDYWNAANFLSVGQLYLLDNPLLKRKLTYNDVKKKIVGHFGTVPGQNFIYVHLNRLIKDYGLNMIYISGPGHGGNGLIANTYLEGSYTKVYPDITMDEEGMKKLFKRFSFPGGVSSHVSPEVPGSIHEGGELGYSLAHAYGAVLDNPDLIAACVIGDGEAETGPLATSWRLNKFLNPYKDGTVLPILHLNGYKIASPTVLARISHEELEKYFEGLSYNPIFVEGSDPMQMHQKMYEALDEALMEINIIKKYASEKNLVNIKWPMIILRTPKGWTCPKKVNDKIIENSFRAHQVPVNISKDDDSLSILENWLLSYHPDKLFDENGSLREDLKSLIPDISKTMGLNPCANGGLLLKELKIPNFKNYALQVIPGQTQSEDMRVLGSFVRDILKNNPDNFRIFGPDEALSNRLNNIFEVENRSWICKHNEEDEYLSPSGKIMDSYLSEHFCQGALEGYLLTGRHGFIHSYEAFIRIVDSMASQHAKWLKMSNDLSWRKDISSLNYVLTSHVWQQDHNGFTHQDPGFLNHLVTKKADTIRLYLPPDSNCLLTCFNHIIQTKNYINVIVASKHLRPQWLNMDDAINHCAKGLGIWDFIANDEDPDIVIACAGDTPTLEAIAAVTILKTHLKDIRIRFVNVVDLMRLQSEDKHPHGLSDEQYDEIFTKNKPILFNFHGYPSLIHELTYNRHNQNMHVRGYIEEGTITTPFDMRVLNNIDRFHLTMDVLKYVPDRFGVSKDELMSFCQNKLIEHMVYIKQTGVDMPYISNWRFDEEKKHFL